MTSVTTTHHHHNNSSNTSHTVSRHQQTQSMQPAPSPPVYPPNSTSSYQSPYTHNHTHTPTPRYTPSSYSYPYSPYQASYPVSGGSAAASTSSSSVPSQYYLSLLLSSHSLLSAIQPCDAAHHARRSLFASLSSLLSHLSPFPLFLFGSVPLHTYLPNGDIDIGMIVTPADEGDKVLLKVKEMLEQQEKRWNERESKQSSSSDLDSHSDSVFPVHSITYISGAEVKLVKCGIGPLLVDISTNTTSALATVCFLEEMDREIDAALSYHYPPYICGQSPHHLYKQSVLLVKCWSLNESHILASHHSLLSTYAIETMIIYILNHYHHHLHHSAADPFLVLTLFMNVFAEMNWEEWGVTVTGPIRVQDLSTPEFPNHHLFSLSSGALSIRPILASAFHHSPFPLLSPKLFHAFHSTYSLPSPPHNSPRLFIPKHMNIVDPLDLTNNLGRSVSFSNMWRIRRCLKKGSSEMGVVARNARECVDLMQKEVQLLVEQQDRDIQMNKHNKDVTELFNLLNEPPAFDSVMANIANTIDQQQEQQQQGSTIDIQVLVPPSCSFQLFSPALLSRLTAHHALFRSVFRHTWKQHIQQLRPDLQLQQQLKQLQQQDRGSYNRQGSETSTEQNHMVVNHSRRSSNLSSLLHEDEEVEDQAAEEMNMMRTLSDTTTLTRATKVNEQPTRNPQSSASHSGQQKNGHQHQQPQQQSKGSTHDDSGLCLPANASPFARTPAAARSLYISTASHYHSLHQLQLLFHSMHQGTTTMPQQQQQPHTTATVQSSSSVSAFSPLLPPEPASAPSDWRDTQSPRVSASCPPSPVLSPELRGGKQQLNHTQPQSQSVSNSHRNSHTQPISPSPSPSSSVYSMQTDPLTSSLSLLSATFFNLKLHHLSTLAQSYPELLAPQQRQCQRDRERERIRLKYEVRDGTQYPQYYPQQAQMNMNHSQPMPQQQHRHARDREGAPGRKQHKSRGKKQPTQQQTQQQTQQRDVEMPSNHPHPHSVSQTQTQTRAEQDELSLIHQQNGGGIRPAPHSPLSAASTVSVASSNSALSAQSSSVVGPSSSGSTSVQSHISSHYQQQLQQQQQPHPQQQKKKQGKPAYKNSQPQSQSYQPQSQQHHQQQQYQPSPYSAFPPSRGGYTNNGNQLPIPPNTAPFYPMQHPAFHSPSLSPLTPIAVAATPPHPYPPQQQQQQQQQTWFPHTQHPQQQPFALTTHPPLHPQWNHPLQSHQSQQQQSVAVPSPVLSSAPVSPVPHAAPAAAVPSPSSPINSASPVPSSSITPTHSAPVVRALRSARHASLPTTSSTSPAGSGHSSPLQEHVNTFLDQSDARALNAAITLKQVSASPPPAPSAAAGARVKSVQPTRPANVNASASNSSDAAEKDGDALCVSADVGNGDMSSNTSSQYSNQQQLTRRRASVDSHPKQQQILSQQHHHHTQLPGPQRQAPAQPSWSEILTQHNKERVTATDTLSSAESNYQSRGQPAAGLDNASTLSSTISSTPMPTTPTPTPVWVNPISSAQLLQSLSLHAPKEATIPVADVETQNGTFDAETNLSATQNSLPSSVSSSSSSSSYSSLSSSSSSPSRRIPVIYPVPPKGEREIRGRRKTESE